MKDGLLAALDQRKPKYNIYGCVIAFQLMLKKELLLTDLEKEQQVVKDVLVRVPFTSMTAAQEEDEEDEEEEERDEEEVRDEEDEVGFEEDSPSTGHNKKSRTKHAHDFCFYV
ncbi:hypothetical protein HHK36_022507 [Tetracentron sinense]|uniref:Uncharacterized protein n=1 Tax=Tetracentron sinense TaxID=13715 RepID=A0A834YPZ0_TETSI|nr:hypothetical protein HHK36_022507 [Tetracentron sinense]